MTTLNRPVRRKTAKIYRGKRNLCFAAYPTYVEIWEFGRWNRVTVDYETIYELALKLRWRKEQAEKKVAKRTKRV